MIKRREYGYFRKKIKWKYIRSLRKFGENLQAIQSLFTVVQTSVSEEYGFVFTIAYWKLSNECSIVFRTRKQLIPIE